MRTHPIFSLPVRSIRATIAALALAMLAIAPATRLSAQATPEGHWEGAIAAGNQQTKLTLDLARNVKAEWIASMGVPADNATGLVVMDVAVSGNAVKFVAVELMMSRVELTLVADGRMTGTFTGPQGPTPVEFKRTGEARVELIPASPAVSKQLEGDWEGTLQTPGRPFLMVFHFRNQPDNTVQATIDTPDTNAFGLPLNDVKQTGQNVEFDVRVAHGHFHGTLNGQGTELAGQFSHEQNGMPLTLRKK